MMIRPFPLPTTGKLYFITGQQHFSAKGIDVYSNMRLRRH